MDVYLAHLKAQDVSERLRVAHAYRSASVDPIWERSELTIALGRLDELVALIPAIQDRLANIGIADQAAA
jgi:hypothetical protein